MSLYVLGPIFISRFPLELMDGFFRQKRRIHQHRLRAENSLLSFFFFFTYSYSSSSFLQFLSNLVRSLRLRLAIIIIIHNHCCSTFFLFVIASNKLVGQIEVNFSWKSTVEWQLWPQLEELEEQEEMMFPFG
jgi:hypothetical protein